MKFAIIGGGSMGKRRIRCLLANQVAPQNIRLIDTREDRQAEARRLYNVDSIGTLQAAFDWGAEAILICTPGAYHLELELTAARAGKHFFCEVPLANTLQGTDELAKLVAAKGIVAASGVQPPFHPLFKTLQQWIAEPSFGKPLALLTEFGSYLPDWHPYEDYRKFYAADQSLGGGNIDVIAQELATLYWLLQDRIKEVYARGSRLTTLEIKASDCWQLVGTTDKGMAVTLQFDLIQRVARNVIRIISEQGTAELDLAAGTVRRYLAQTRQWETRSLPTGYIYEQCYIDEIKHFLQCIKGEATWHNALPVATDIVKFIDAMIASARQNKPVNV